MGPPTCRVRNIIYIVRGKKWSMISAWQPKAVLTHKSKTTRVENLRSDTCMSVQQNRFIILIKKKKKIKENTKYRDRTIADNFSISRSKVAFFKSFYNVWIQVPRELQTVSDLGPGRKQDRYKIKVMKIIAANNKNYINKYIFYRASYWL